MLCQYGQMNSFMQSMHQNVLNCVVIVKLGDYALSSVGRDELFKDTV